MDLVVRSGSSSLFTAIGFLLAVASSSKLDASPVIGSSCFGEPPTSFTDRSTFHAAFVITRTESFESALVPSASVRSFDAPLDGCSLAFEPASLMEGFTAANDPGPSAQGLTAFGANHDGNPSRCIGTSAGTDALVLTFDPPVYGVGMDLQVRGVASDTFDVQVTLQGASPWQGAVSASPGGLFFGLGALETITSLTIRSQTMAVVAIDDLVVAPIEVPSSVRSMMIDRASFQIDFGQKAATGIEAQDGYAVRGRIDPTQLVTDGGFSARVELAGVVTFLSELAIRGTVFTWTTEPGVSPRAMLSLDDLTGVVEAEVEGIDLDDAISAGNGTGEASHDARFVVSFGFLEFANTLRFAYQSNRPDTTGKGLYRPRGDALPEGAFLVERVTFQQRSTRTGDLERARIRFVYAPGANTQPNPVTGGLLLQIGDTVVHLGDGVNTPSFEGEGSRYRFVDRETSPQYPIRSAKVDVERWHIDVQTDWIPVGAFGIPPATPEVQITTLRMGLCFPQSSGSAAASPVIIEGRNGRWSNRLRTPRGR